MTLRKGVYQERDRERERKRERGRDGERERQTDRQTERVHLFNADHSRPCAVPLRVSP